MNHDRLRRHVSRLCQYIQEYLSHAMGDIILRRMSFLILSAIQSKWRPNDNDTSLTCGKVQPRNSAEPTLMWTACRFVADAIGGLSFSLPHRHLVILGPK